MAAEIRGLDTSIAGLAYIEPHIGKPSLASAATDQNDDNERLPRGILHNFSINYVVGSIPVPTSLLISERERAFSQSGFSLS